MAPIEKLIALFDQLPDNSEDVSTAFNTPKEDFVCQKILQLNGEIFATFQSLALELLHKKKPKKEVFDADDLVPILIITAQKCLPPYLSWRPILNKITGICDRYQHLDNAAGMYSICTLHGAISDLLDVNRPQIEDSQFAYQYEIASAIEEKFNATWKAVEAREYDNLLPLFDHMAALSIYSNHHSSLSIQEKIQKLSDFEQKASKKFELIDRHTLYQTKFEYLVLLIPYIVNREDLITPLYNKVTTPRYPRILTLFLRLLGYNHKGLSPMQQKMMLVLQKEDGEYLKHLQNTRYFIDASLGDLLPFSAQILREKNQYLVDLLRETAKTPKYPRVPIMLLKFFGYDANGLDRSQQDMKATLLDYDVIEQKSKEPDKKILGSPGVMRAHLQQPNVQTAPRQNGTQSTMNSPLQTTPSTPTKRDKSEVTIRLPR